jgi:hypothetical protein
MFGQQHPAPGADSNPIRKGAGVGWHGVTHGGRQGPGDPNRIRLWRRRLSLAGLRRNRTTWGESSFFCEHSSIYWG